MHGYFRRPFCSSSLSPSAQTTLYDRRNGEGLVSLLPETGTIHTIHAGGGELPAGSTLPAGRLQKDEKFLGAAWSHAGEKLLLVIEMPGVNTGNRTSRVDIRDTLTGERIQFLRSTWSAGGVDHYKTPIAAAFHPNGRWLLVNWRLTGVQLWDIGSWELVQHW